MKPEILGIGNPIFDVCVHVDEEILQSLHPFIPNAEWEGVYHIDDSVFEQMLLSLNTKPTDVVPGGGALNTIRVLSQLGHSTAFAGALGAVPTRFTESTGSNAGSAGNAVSGMDFRRELRGHGIQDYTVEYPNRPCGRSLCLKNGSREILIFNPAAAALLRDAEELPIPIENINAEIVYIEGFLLPRHTLMEAFLALCRNGSSRLAVDLGAAPIAAAQKDFLFKEVLPLTSFLFGTEEEYAALDRSLEDLSTAAASRICLIVKKGAAGSRVVCAEQSYETAAYPVEEVNSSGAGDAYAAFFLSHMLRGYQPAAAARVASYGSSLFLSGFGGALATAEVKSVPEEIHTRG
ncbi:MAG: carbohydrate kinase family protein [Spirochaetota bacterium]